MGIEISKKATISVSADKVWSILADDFDKIGEWARAVDSSGPNVNAEAPEGANVGGRVCQAPGFGAIDETFTSFEGSAPGADVRQILGRPGEVWAPESGTDRLMLIRTGDG